MSEPIPCLIRTLAPVHLGADEVYEPLNFIIDEKNHCLVAFEPGSFLEKLPERDRQEFSKLCQKGTVTSLLEIYRFFRERRRLARGRMVNVCPGLLDHYREVLASSPRDFGGQLTRFTIHRTAYLAHDQRPYIPGSAVKGALRTAYLNARAQGHPLPTPKNQKGRWDPRTLENGLLDYRNIDEDPFRLLKVSDFVPVGEVKTRIVYAVNEKKKASQFAARGPYQILEVIEPGAEFLGAIRVEDFPPEMRRLAKIKHFVAYADLWAAVRKFYPQEKAAQDQSLFEIGLSASPLPQDPGVAPLRLGRHSGAECVTIAGHRHIKIMQARGERPKELPHATTLWLAADFHQRDQRREANLRPFGWVALQELNPAEAEALEVREEEWRREMAALPAAPLPSAVQEAPAAEPTPAPAPPATLVWEGARLTWNPGKQEVTAAWEGKKATGKGRDLIPEALQKRLLKDRKAVTARVTVEPVGLAFRLVSIEPPP
jgi:CRISPR-associated protein Csm5